MAVNTHWHAGMLTIVLLNSSTALAELSANINLTSNYVSKGLTQTDNNPALQGGLDYVHGNGLYVGGFGSNVNKGFELDVYAGYYGELNTLGYDIGYMTYNYTDDTFSEDTTEFYAGGLYRQFKLYYSLGKYGDIDYTYLDLMAEFDLSDLATLKLHYGLLTFDTVDDDYYDYKISISRDFSGYDLSLSYTAEELMDEKHVFVTISKSFEL